MGSPNAPVIPDADILGCHALNETFTSISVTDLLHIHRVVVLPDQYLHRLPGAAVVAQPLAAFVIYGELHAATSGFSLDELANLVVQTVFHYFPI